MIDVQNEVFTGITTALQTAVPSVKTSSEYNDIPSSFPFVSIEQIEDAVYEKGSDSCRIENFAEISFEINCYSQGNLKKSECSRLAEVADNYMNSVGFIRRSRVPMQDQNNTKYRIVLRYSGIIDRNGKVYRR